MSCVASMLKSLSLSLADYWFSQISTIPVRQTSRSSLGLLCMQIVVMEAEMVLHVHKEKYQNHDNFVLFIYCVLFFFFLLQPPLLKAIFNVDPDEVRSLIFKKEDVNAQVSPTVTNICICFLILLLFLGGA